MLIKVTVKPRSRRNEVRKSEDGTLIVAVTAAPEGGKANEKVVELLSAYFKRPKRDLNIVRGRTSRHKIIELP